MKNDQKVCVELEVAFRDFEAGKLSAALMRLEALIEREPLNFDALNGAGIVACRVNDLKNACGYLARAQAINPIDPACAHNLVVAALKIDDLDLAEHAVKSALIHHPNAADFLQLDKVIAARRKLRRLTLMVVSQSDLHPDPGQTPHSDDRWFCLGLKQALSARGVTIRNNFDSHVFLLLHGDLPPLVRGDMHKIIWILCHPNRISRGKLAVFDHIFSLSPVFTRKLAKQGIPSETLIGGTAMTPIAPTPSIEHGIVFIGNAHNLDSGRYPSLQPVIETILSLGDKWVSHLEIWGRGWQGLVPRRCIKGESCDFRVRNKLYASSLVVLHDHDMDMRVEGFFNPRILDVMASGGLAISEPLSGTDEIFGEALPVYHTAAELKAFLDQCGQDPAFRAGWIEKGLKTAAQYSFAQAADRLVRYLLALDEDKLSDRRVRPFGGRPEEEMRVGDSEKYDVL